MHGLRANYESEQQIMKINYQKRLDQTIAELTEEGKVPTLLLHSCCGPCSTYVLEYLSQHFRIYVLYYNPNIYPKEEYFFREAEQKKLIDTLETIHPVTFLAAKYQPERYYEAVKGHEKDPEGGERCALCFALRLREAARAAKEHGFDYFTTTLSISPHKNAQRLNEIGEQIGKEEGVLYLYADFKKKGGFLRSVERTKEHGLYRQDYCGCVFSTRDSKNGTG